MIRSIRKFFFDRKGSATMEFAVAFPFFIGILMMFTEVGILTLRTAMLKRGMSVATRDVRIGDTAVQNLEGFRASVCDNAFFLPDCSNSLLVEMTKIEDGDFTEFKCVNREDPDWSPKTDFDPGNEEEIMLVRACILVKPVFPGSGMTAGLWQGLGGDYALVATTAFMNEPK